MILVHPEYHSVLDNLSEQLHQNYTTDTNPFFTYKFVFRALGTIEYESSLGNQILLSTIAE
ncbi:DUF1841 family protein [Candidatus Coxiella mudrowiae]|uniref:DUF1841 family protein n=1 Tax=Candidatus Coxiella mudrowiae TaxID=2054173 RepID=UPI000C28B215